jgi:hypothetical protein
LHSKSIVNWLAILTLILISVSVLTFSFTTAATTGLENRTEFLFSLVQNANATVTDVYRRIEAKSLPIPQDSLTEYDQALLLANQATNLLHAGNYSEANRKALQALQKFKEALRIVYETIPEQPTDAEITFQKTVAVKSAIDRSYEQLQRLENLTGFAASAGYNTTSLEAKIETIKTLLDTASSNLNQKNLEAASNSTAEAKALIDNLMGYVHNLATTLKIQRLAAYVAQTEERLSKLRTEAISAQNAASLTALNDADASLANAKKYLGRQLINETLAELESSKISEEKAVEYLKPTATSSSSPTATPSLTNESPSKTPSAEASTATK